MPRIKWFSKKIQTSGTIAVPSGCFAAAISIDVIRFSFPSVRNVPIGSWEPVTNGLKPVTISVDNYFVEREETPLDEDGNYDFESINAIDTKLLNQDLVKLLNGEEIEAPTFNFHTGHKEYRGNKMRLNADEVLIMEGIHCLNDELTYLIPKEQKYKIYISC